MKEREVINALLTIKEYCESMSSCELCMFGKESEYICYVYDCKVFEGNEPKNWKVEVKINDKK